MQIGTTPLLLNPTSVDASGPWLFWKSDPPPALVASLATAGQLDPLLVEEQVSGYSLLAGSQRFAALASLGKDVLAFPVGRSDGKPLTEVQKGLAYVHSNISRPVDRIMALAALRYFHFYLTPKQLDVDIAPLLGMHPRSREWRLITQWFSLPQGYDAHLEAGRAPLEIAAPIAALHHKDQQVLEPLFRGVRWSRSAAVECVTLLIETARANEKPLAAVAEELLALARKAEEENLSPNDAVRRMLDKARAMRRPTLARLEGARDDLTRTLAGGGPWRLTQPDSFESPAVELSVRVRSRAELDAAVADLQRMAGAAEWDALWSLGDAAE